VFARSVPIHVGFAADMRRFAVIALALSLPVLHSHGAAG